LCGPKGGYRKLSNLLPPVAPDRQIRALGPHSGAVAYYLRVVAHYLVDIRGDAYRAMGLLAKAGIQNIPVPQAISERVIARVSSESDAQARGRVLAALLGEAFTVESPRLEH
jgi:hypothetical protein